MMFKLNWSLLLLLVTFCSPFLCSSSEFPETPLVYWTKSINTVDDSDWSQLMKSQNIVWFIQPCVNVDSQVSVGSTDSCPSINLIDLMHTGSPVLKQWLEQPNIHWKKNTLVAGDDFIASEEENVRSIHDINVVDDETLKEFNFPKSSQPFVVRIHLPAVDRDAKSGLLSSLNDELFTLIKAKVDKEVSDNDNTVFVYSGSRSSLPVAHHGHSRSMRNVAAWNSLFQKNGVVNTQSQKFSTLEDISEFSLDDVLSLERVSGEESDVDSAFAAAATVIITPAGANLFFNRYTIFTKTVWVVLFVSFIFLSITFFGITWLMDLSK